jgi:hypothetical protein
MAFTPLLTGIRAALEYSKDGQVIVNIYHVTTTQPINTTNLTALANIFLTWWYNTARQQSSESLVLQRVIATDWTTANGAQITTTPIPAQAAGTLIGAPVPNNVALVVTGLTGQSGRSYRGRTYWAGLMDSETDTNYITTFKQTAMLNVYNTLRAQLSAGNFVLGVASFYADGLPRLIGILTPYTGFRVSLRVDTQRRRLPPG